MLRQLILLALFSTPWSVFGQHQCAHDPAIHGQLELAQAILDATERGGSGDTLYVGIKYHAVSGFGSSQVPAASVLREVNEIFAVHKIQFVHCGEALSYVDNDIYTDNGTGYTTRKQNAVAGLINVFIVGYISIIPGAGGYATYDEIVIAGPLYQPQLLAHELGHILGLPHTFDTTFGAELVDGSNCSTAGDLFCDTPADPGSNIQSMLDSCTYVGTVMDANGDLYTPDVGNIMSYGGRCTEHFSVEQGIRMYNVLNIDKWYLQQFSQIRSLELADNYFLCSNDSTAYPLQGTPSGGSFSGGGVVGNTFTPALAGAGDHSIAYTLPGISDSIEVIRPYMARVLANTTTDTLLDLWQSMKMDLPGRLMQIKQLLELEQTTVLNLSLYTGEGVAGTPFYTNSYTLNATAGFEWIELDLDSMAVSLGDTITYRISSSAPMIVKKANQYVSAYWLESVSNWGSIFVHFHGAVVRTPEPCGDIVYEHTHIYEVEPGSIIELNPTYCVAGDSVELFGIPNDGTFLVNADTANALDPAVLGIGTHTVSYTTSDVHGCISTVYEQVEVEPFPVLFSVPLGPYCDTLSAQVHGGIPAGGVLQIDGIAVDSILPMQLSVGGHTASYYVEQINDTVYKLDQEKNHVVGHQVWPLPEVQLNTAYWQSFVAGETGVLDRVQMTDYNWGQQEFEVFFYKGHGLSGDLLHSDTLVFAAVTAYTFVDLIAPSYDLPIYKDSSYTAGFRWLSGPNWPPMYLAVDTGNTYSAGQSVFDDTLGVNYYDMYFKNIVRQYRYCRDSVSAVFDVVDCISTSLGEVSEGGLQVFPNPSDGEIQIISQELIGRIAIYNSLGELVRSSALNARRYDINGLAAGSYLLVVQQGSEEQHRQVVVY